MDRGLFGDLEALFSRRLALGVLGAAGLASLVGCGGRGTPEAATTTPATTTPGAGTSGGASCVKIPAETAGPYPGDSLLAQSGIVRSDIRSSFGPASGVAKGVPLTVNLTIVDTSKSCAPYAGAAVYIWQCDMTGGYSMYTPAVSKENYLRGVQEADASGLVSFKSIFPGAYGGRWPHIHFEVYSKLAGTKVLTSQLALPSTVCETVYATPGYQQSTANLRRSSLGADSVFRDGYAQQLAMVGGNVADGYVATLAVPV